MGELVNNEKIYKIYNVQVLPSTWKCGSYQTIGTSFPNKNPMPIHVS